ncbi:MAG: acetyl-CoA C-acyltransferase [Anaerolineae bacterium]|nr:acetyl-CoA C-acyltransferase [Anaerolineae bacterium]NIN95643.1 acetyl-CoA C-acyltransferase [Anaerolineae bacterium]
MLESVILGAVRTPVGRKNGSLRDVRAEYLAAHVINEVLARTGIEAKAVDDAVFGCNTQIEEQGLNVARIAVLTAGLPETVAGTTVNRQCGSSLQACNIAAMAVATGQSDIVIGGGVESMTRVPMGSDAGVFNEKLLARYDLVPQGVSAELIAEKWGLTREELDEYSLMSHRRAIAAIDAGRFKDEIVPVPVKNEDGKEVLFEVDEHPRRETSLEKLAKLPAAFKPDGMVTAGNSSGINDGAAALVFATKDKAQELGLEPMATVRTMAVAGVDPVIMLTGPIPASRKALKKADLTMNDVDLVELNEAFASVALACSRELNIDHEKMNPNGGAIALGHPLGASGARILTTLLYEMERRDVRWGLATLCIGFGQGIATIVEREAAA